MIRSDLKECTKEGEQMPAPPKAKKARKRQGMRKGEKNKLLPAERPKGKGRFSTLQQSYEVR